MPENGADRPKVPRPQLGKHRQLRPRTESQNSFGIKSQTQKELMRSGSPTDLNAPTRLQKHLTVHIALYFCTNTIVKDKALFFAPIAGVSHSSASQIRILCTNLSDQTGLQIPEMCAGLKQPGKAVIPAVSVPALVPDLSRGQMNVAVKTTACSGECEAACCFTASEKGASHTPASHPMMRERDQPGAYFYAHRAGTGQGWKSPLGSADGWLLVSSPALNLGRTGTQEHLPPIYPAAYVAASNMHQQLKSCPAVPGAGGGQIWSQVKLSSKELEEHCACLHQEGLEAGETFLSLKPLVSEGSHLQLPNCASPSPGGNEDSYEILQNWFRERQQACSAVVFLNINKLSTAGNLSFCPERNQYISEHSGHSLIRLSPMNASDAFPGTNDTFDFGFPSEKKFKRWISISREAMNCKRSLESSILQRGPQEQTIQDQIPAQQRAQLTPHEDICKYPEQTGEGGTAALREAMEASFAHSWRTSRLCSIITCSRKEFDMCKNEVYCATKFVLSFINDRLFPCTSLQQSREVGGGYPHHAASPEEASKRTGNQRNTTASSSSTRTSSNN
ncbi:hypothetical protein Anapl_01441 [Anas platyrhynchos]|uniref:Uncharacterized protein n=1 Tax=Anas platyrhynchos TaxID=8839 RepID=R0K392_ANAPL|nr:hypothetical protein Anapl_01441 [Anas platyrhynchos]